MSDCIYSLGYRAEWCRVEGCNAEGSGSTLCKRREGHMDTDTVPEPPRCDCGLPAIAGNLCIECLPTCSHGDLIARLQAFARNCVEHGDMTPTAERMLHSILGISR